MPPTLYPPGKLPPDALAHFLGRYTDTHPALVVPPGLGEDAAVLDIDAPHLLVAKSDPITFATERAGWYAVHVNANDIAAMGGTPRFFLSTLIIPQQEASPEHIDGLFASIHAACDRLGIAVVGGHTEITTGLDRTLCIGHMLGTVPPQRLTRSSGLRPGDTLLLTKGMGIEATAILAAEKRPELLATGFTATELDRCSAFLDDPGISVVADARIALDAGGVTALHDPTEGGVATGLAEMATASDVGLEVFADALPLADSTRRLCAAFGLDPFGIISSGALLIGARAAAADTIQNALEKAGIPTAVIGTVHPPDYGLQLHQDGAVSPLPTFKADELTRIFA